MRYFLTGGTGFIGGTLARQLREAGHEVVCIVRNPDKAVELFELECTLVKGDITDKESMRQAMTGCDGVFHLAAWYKLGVTVNLSAEKINVLGTSNVLELMKELNIPKGVYTSTLAVHSNTHGKEVDETNRHTPEKGFLSVYERTKWRAHYEVAEPMMAEGLPLVVVMPGVVYGPDDPSAVGKTFRDWLNGKLPAIPKRNEYSWGHVEDVARAHILAMDKAEPGSFYHICGPSHSLVEAFAIASQAVGVAPPRAIVPPGLLRVMAGFSAVFESVLNFPPEMRAEYLRTNAGVTYLGSNAKAREELGYAPRSLSDGLSETLTYEKEQLAKG